MLSERQARAICRALHRDPDDSVEVYQSELGSWPYPVKPLNWERVQRAAEEAADG